MFLVIILAVAAFLCVVSAVPVVTTDAAAHTVRSMHTTAALHAARDSVAAMSLRPQFNSSQNWQFVTGTWTTAQLSQARHSLAATSLPYHGLALFAGGDTGENYPHSVVDTIDLFSASSGLWSTYKLSVARSFLAAASLLSQNLALFAGGYDGYGYSDAVDIFNSISMSWSTACLSVARFALTGLRVIVPGANANYELVMFAGGQNYGGLLLSLFFCPLSPIKV